MRIIRVGSRDSALAKAQANLVIETVKRTHPKLTLKLVTMKTSGDKLDGQPLDAAGGKGLFIKELEQALREGKVDFCVHSCKDLPMEISSGLPIIAYGLREDARDVLVPPAGSKQPDFTKPVGFAGKRRQVQLEAIYPQWQHATVRGNVNTRLTKLDAGQYGGLVLAAAGMRRLGLWDRVGKAFSTREVLPAAGQGIIALQTRYGEDMSILDCYNDPHSQDMALAERAFIRALDGGCSAPVAAHARIFGTQIYMEGLYVRADGKMHRGSQAGSREDAGQLGEELAQRLKREGDAL